MCVKLEWENPTGSVKDRTASAVISRAEADGRLKPGNMVVECGATLTIVPSEGGRTTKTLILDMISAVRVMADSALRYLNAPVGGNRAVTRAIHLIAAASCLLLPAAAKGQSPPCARPAFERVARMQGRWRVDWSIRVAQGRMERTVAAAEITAVIPQCALLERITATVENRPFWAAVVLTTQDTARRVWIDSNHGEPVVFEGVWDADTLAFHWTRRIEARELRLRHLYFALTPDSFRTATWLSPSPSQGWQLVGEASYRRERGC